MKGYSIQLDIRWYGSEADWKDFQELLEELEKDKVLGVYGMRFESNYNYNKYDY